MRDKLLGLAGTLRDAADVLRHTRSLTEVARTLVPALRPVVLLNAPPAGNPVTAGAAGDAATRLGGLRRRLQAEVLDHAGRVDYARLAGGATYAELVATSQTLAGARLAAVHGSDAERLAFWINLYNVLCMHGVVALGIRRSVMEVPTFFARVAYRVGEHVLTLDEIENGVLRRNAPHPVTGRRLLADDDPRAALAPSRLDPRVHAALVCAARSCPPVAVYDAERLEAQLAAASAHLIGAGVDLDEQARCVRLPLVLRWYQADFGGAAGLRAYVLDHAGAEQRPALARAFAEGWRLAWQRYDWTLNAA